MKGHLVLHSDGKVLQHMLEGKRVKTGDVLEVYLADGHRLVVRYEWDGVRLHAPVFHCRLSGTLEEAELSLPSDAILRWPRSQAAKPSQESPAAPNEA